MDLEKDHQKDIRKWLQPIILSKNEKEHFKWHMKETSNGMSWCVETITYTISRWSKFNTFKKTYCSSAISTSGRNGLLSYVLYKEKEPTFADIIYKGLSYTIVLLLNVQSMIIKE